MTFCEALAAFQAGSKIRRKKWTNTTYMVRELVEQGSQKIAVVGIHWHSPVPSDKGMQLSRQEIGFDLFDIEKSDWEVLP